MSGANRAASVRQKLTNRSKERGEDFQVLLLRYANDRMLYRLSISEYWERFVLKGATLFSIWSSELHRVTRDVDLLGFGQVNEEYLFEVFRSITAMSLDDGLHFDSKSIAVAPIRKGQTYGGLRVTMKATLGTARLNLQIDVGLGDTHRGKIVNVPPLLDVPAARLQAYERETVVAEKLEAAVRLGASNSRMKDFYDIATLAQDFAFEGPILVAALTETFERRDTRLPEKSLAELLQALKVEPSKPLQWRAFMKKAAPRNSWSLEEAFELVAAFAEEPLAAAAINEPFNKSWQPGGPWRDEGEAESPALKSPRAFQV